MTDEAEGGKNAMENECQSWGKQIHAFRIHVTFVSALFVVFVFVTSLAKKCVIWGQ